MYVAPLSTSELLPDCQEFPRVMLFEFQDTMPTISRPVARLVLLDAWPNAFPDGPIELESGKLQGYHVPGQLGNELTNNSTTDDGYRFHDAFHIGMMTKLGWSPVMRSLLGVKRRSNLGVDEVDDGARAIIFEESLIDFLGVSEVKNESSLEDDIDLTFAALSLSRFFKTRSTILQQFRHETVKDALLESALLFQRVREKRGGYVIANLDSKSLYFEPASHKS